MENELAAICGQIVACMIWAGVVTLFFKDKSKKRTAFIISFFIFLLVTFGSAARKPPATYRASIPIAEQKAPTKYKANLQGQKTIELSSEKDKIHVSRSEGMNAQQVFLDNCELTLDEQSVYKNNAEFQKAFTVIFTLDSQNSMLRELSNKCSGVDLLKTNNPNKLWFDRELSKNKEIFIKHLGQSQYNCFEKHVLQDFGSKIALVGAGALYSQLQSMAAGRMSTCALLADRTFQSEMYSGMAETMNKVINNNDPLVWKAPFNITLPEQNEFDLPMPGVK